MQTRHNRLRPAVLKGKEVYLFFAILVLIMILLYPFKSNSPDGLEKVAENNGFADKAWEVK